MTRFCTNCGGRIAEDSIFCEYCGSKVKTSTPSKTRFREESQPLEKPVYNSYNQVSSVPSYTSSYRPSSSSNWAKWLFLGVFVVVIIGFAAVILVGLVFLPFGFNMFNQYEYIGDLTEYIGEDLTNNTYSIDLEIDNSVGTVNVEIIDRPILFEAQIHIYAREGHDIENANTFDIGEYEDHYSIFFDSSSAPDWDNPYYYDLDIMISNQTTTGLDIKVSSGEIYVYAHQTNISSLSLDTSTGSITAVLDEVNFSSSQNFILHTSTGSVSAYFTNVLYVSSEIEWLIETSTGSIDLDVSQEIVDNNTVINYDADTSTGSIHFTYELNTTIGLQLDANVSTGDIYTQGNPTDDNYFFKSGNYDSASMKINVLLDTSTGSIYIQ